jgi:peptidyl-Asp metalloendopeptidase
VPAPAGTANEVADYGAGAAATTAASGIVQDLLVVYTPASVSRAGSEATLQSQIANAVAAANTAYANSQIGITLNVVGMALTQYTETGDMGAALSALRSPNDGLMDEVHALRDQAGADLVALINEDGNYCGIAYVMTSVGSSFASYAFGVTARNCLSNQTLAHEIGHNQGNQHDRETVAANGGGSGAYPYSFGYRRCVTGGFRTVMSYSCTGGTRVSHFSNPSVLFNGEVTGIAYESDPANSADNARSMGNTAAVIAGLRTGAVTSPPAAPSGLGVTPASSTSLTLRWTDHAGDEAGFEAWRSDSGVAGSFQKVATLGANATSWTDNTLSPLTTRWYQVRAYNAAGSSAFTTAASAQTFEGPPAAPSAVAAAYDAGLAAVAITWTDGAGTETGFEIRRETLNARKGTWGSAVTVASVGAGARGYADKPAGGTYRYSVRGVNAGGSSAWSAPSASVTVPGSTVKGRR